MELYRHIHGPDPSCTSYKFLTRILRNGAPDVDIAHLRVDELRMRDDIVFYPKSRIKGILANEAVVTDIIRCRCPICARYLKCSEEDLTEMVQSILNTTYPKIILLAVLIYLGRIYMIKELSRLDGLDDNKLGSLLPSTLDPSTWTQLLETESKEDFLANYYSAVNLFDLPEFSTELDWTRDHTPGRRFPFLDDSPHREGSFGEVRKFNIHDDYLKLEEKYLKQSWYTSQSSHKFARKILKTTDPLDWRLEKAALRAISAQEHPNIIELLFVYRCRGQYTFVFPFVEKNLYDVIRQQWRPQGESDSSRGSLGQNWLWRQIVQVASALSAIHQPRRRPAGTTDQLIGFHLDLKPANILVTRDGVLKITDFGQALIKSVGANDSTYGINRGGSPIYQAPEARPTPESLRSGKYDGRVYRRYDIWSLACIMLEVIIYIFDGPENGIAKFEEARKNETGGGAFYSATDPAMLKPCVKAMFDKYQIQRNTGLSDMLYLQNVLDLLQQMFSFDQQKRPTSEEVYAELQSFGLSSLPKGGVHQELSCLLKQHPIPEGYDDIGRQNGSSLSSFFSLDNVHFRPSTDSTESMVPCRIRILRNSKSRSLQLDRFSGEHTLSKTIFSLGDKSYVPVDLYERTPTSNSTRACIAGKDASPWILVFGSTDLLLDFRSAILGNEVILSSQKLLRSVSIHKPGMAQPHTIHGTIRMELWRRRKAQALSPQSRRSTQSQSTNPLEESSSYLRIMIFFAENQRFVNIPLHKGENRAEALGAEGGSSSAIKVVPSKDTDHNSFSISDVNPSSKGMPSPLPLTCSGFETLEKDMVRQIDLRFQDPAEMARTRSLIKDYSKWVWK